MAVISIDLGTTGCKAGVFDGPEALGIAVRRQAYASRAEGWADQDAEEAWNLVRQVVRESLDLARRPRIRAVCVSVQGDAILPVDAAGRPLHAAILGMDIRSHREAEDLEARFGREELYERTGMPCEPLNAITKVLWLERHRPELRARLWKYLHYQEFLLHRLCGTPAIEPSMASRTMAYDPAGKRWIGEILDFVGIGPEHLGEPRESGSVAGAVRREVAEDLGIDTDAAVVLGGHDQCMAAIGAGVIEPGLACYSMGTAEVTSTCFREDRRTREMLAANYPCYCHAASGLYFTIALNQSGGISLEWFQKLWTDLGGLDEARRADSYARALGAVRLEPSPVVFLPHLVGSGTPSCDHRSRGTFLGLSLATSRDDMFQAVVEALAFEARLNLATLDGLGIPVSALLAVGGGARSRAILELKATVLRRPIRTLAVTEAALLGAAMQAQVAAGEFRDLEEARAACVRIAETIQPRADAAAAYDEAFRRFEKAYSVLPEYYREETRS